MRPESSSVPLLFVLVMDTLGDAPSGTESEDDQRHWEGGELGDLHPASVVGLRWARGAGRPPPVQAKIRQGQRYCRSVGMTFCSKRGGQGIFRVTDYNIYWLYEWVWRFDQAIGAVDMNYQDESRHLLYRLQGKRSERKSTL